MGQRHQKGHVVFDQQHSDALGGNAPDDLGQAHALRCGQTGSGLVKQHQLGPRCQATGNFQQAALAK